LTDHPPTAPLVLLLRVVAGAAAASALVAASPWADALRPWSPGEPLPVVRRLLPAEGAARVEEDARTGLLTAVAGEADAGEAEVDPIALLPPVSAMSAEEVAAVVAAATAVGNADGASPEAVAEEEAAAKRAGGALRADAGRKQRQPSTRGMGFVQAVEDPGHRGLAPWYRALAQSGERVVRAVHFGDSTIAADGVAKTVRERLQERFGAGGPGFVSAAMDPRWNKRFDVKVRRGGTWDTTSLLEGKAPGRRYGLGGTVVVADAGATLTVDALDGAGDPLPLRRVELWYQGGAGAGRVSAKTPDGPLEGRPLAGSGRTDLYWGVDLLGTSPRVSFSVSGGAVPFYGVVLESDRGATWEALGVTAVGSGAYGFQDPAHLADQLQHRRPDLIVVMLGGNDVGLRGLASGDSSAYAVYFQQGLDRLRGPLPEAACLIVSPLDQAVRKGGKVLTKPAIPAIVEAQRKVAAASGCAFWSAFDAMGGVGSFNEWLTHRPALAWTDLMHLSTAGQEILGHLLADALLADFEAFRAAPAAPPAPAIDPWDTWPTSLP
jgi:lysophospholipase L1-like esterase